MKPRASKRKDRHLIPKKGDAVYIDGQWSYQWDEPIWIRPSRTRVNGIIISVAYEDQEVLIRWTDHPYADPEEHKVTCMDFAILYGKWSSKKECYVVTEQDV